MIVRVGFALFDGDLVPPTANPDIETHHPQQLRRRRVDFDGTKDANNVYPLLYKTAEAAFMAG